jgi:hypothetical protein
MQLCGVLTLSLLGVGLQAQSAQVGVDPRVELMSVIFRLAGASEYSQGKIPAYNDAIDRHFAPFREHEAVRIARDLHDREGVGFDAVMSMAIHVKDVESLAETVPFDRATSLDARWRGIKARRFLVAARKFVADSDFAGFVKSEQPFYDSVDKRLRAWVAANADLTWFDRFFGSRTHAPFHLAPGLANGGASYGVHAALADGVEEIYAIPGVWKVDAEGLPVFEASWTGTVVHEFSHSYANPLIDEFAPQLDKSGDRLFEAVSAAMRRQAYGNGRTVLKESLVRAVTARYILEHQGPEAAAREVNEQRKRSFLWTGDLLALLGQYAQDRQRYPTLESFMPQVVAFFADTASRVDELARAYDAGRPKVLSMNITNGATDIDPALKEIVVRFDRPMDRGRFGINDVAAAPSPPMGKASFDESGRVFTVAVTLEPNKEYGFSLNWPGGDVFQSAEGVPLKPVEVRFHTRAAQ